MRAQLVAHTALVKSGKIILVLLGWFLPKLELPPQPGPDRAHSSAADTSVMAYLDGISNACDVAARAAVPIGAGWV